MLSVTAKGCLNFNQEIAVKGFAHMYECLKKYFDVLLTNVCYPFCTIITNITFHSKIIIHRITHETGIIKKYCWRITLWMIQCNTLYVLLLICLHRHSTLYCYTMIYFLTLQKIMDFMNQVEKLLESFHFSKLQD